MNVMWCDVMWLARGKPTKSDAALPLVLFQDLRDHTRNGLSDQHSGMDESKKTATQTCPDSRHTKRNVGLSANKPHFWMSNRFKTWINGRPTNGWPGSRFLRRSRGWMFTMALPNDVRGRTLLESRSIQPFQCTKGMNGFGWSSIRSNWMVSRKNLRTFSLLFFTFPFLFLNDPSNIIEVLWKRK
jgi:hypothetical protein